MCDALFRDETIGPLTLTRLTPINDREFPRRRSLASPDAAATRDLRPLRNGVSLVVTCITE